MIKSLTKIIKNAPFTKIDQHPLIDKKREILFHSFFVTCANNE